jgi:hypothetical protein
MFSVYISMLCTDLARIGRSIYYKAAAEGSMPYNKISHAFKEGDYTEGGGWCVSTRGAY